MLLPFPISSGAFWIQNRNTKTIAALDSSNYYRVVLPNSFKKSLYNGWRHWSSWPDNCQCLNQTHGVFDFLRYE
ncbi:MAG: hypothetical protein COT74_10605 [Bdellovibrionales bacterium CG10_big_fil_rev_8_21_14_0_10_45_34]|nr:MAG: hypothetical protein COT74_10605 [Bdellovibrionales bacterium CG10_big_fil_rev_8_21_14_0_10_45_34]